MDPDPPKGLDPTRPGTPARSQRAGLVAWMLGSVRPLKEPMRGDRTVLLRGWPFACLDREQAKATHK